jgi:glycosyltransferase involved in cell wall biosynthesis
MRLLYLTAETCPTFRVDVAALFGIYLPRNGVYCDIVAGLAEDQVGPVEWGGGDTLLCDMTGGRTRKHVKIMWHGMRHLFLANPSRYDAIQVRDMPVLATIGLIFASIKRLPFYYWMSFPIPEGQIALARERRFSAGVLKYFFPWFTGRLGVFLLYRLVLQRADHVFVQSERMKEDMAAKGVSRALMTSVPMGVDLEAMQIAEISPVIDERLKDRRVLVYLGTLDRPRQIERLFEMMVLVMKRVPGVLLVLVGDTADTVHRTWLREQAEAAGIENAVMWTGWLPMQDAWRYVRAAEVALSPVPRGFLLDRGSPTKVPEYLALGVPVVCNDNPDQASVIEETGAGVCVPYTAEEFSDAVVTMLSTDTVTRNVMIESGRRYIGAKRSYTFLSKELATRYHALLSNPANKSRRRHETNR